MFIYNSFWKYSILGSNHVQVNIEQNWTTYNFFLNSVFSIFSFGAESCTLYYWLKCIANIFIFDTPPSDGDLTRYVTTIQNSSGKSSIEPKKYLKAYGEVPDKEPPNL